MPFLRDELRLSYTVGGLHLQERWPQAWSWPVAWRMARSGAGGARWSLWGGGAGMALGALVLARSAPALTITGAAMMGTLGTFLIIVIQSVLADHHVPLRTVALTESNVGASIGAAGAAARRGLPRIGIGWRGALYAAVLLWAASFLLLRRTDCRPPPC